MFTTFNLCAFFSEIQSAFLNEFNIGAHTGQEERVASIVAVWLGSRSAVQAFSQGTNPSGGPLVCLGILILVIALRRRLSSGRLVTTEAVARRPRRQPTAERMTVCRPNLLCFWTQTLTPRIPGGRVRDPGGLSRMDSPVDMPLQMFGGFSSAAPRRKPTGNLERNAAGTPQAIRLGGVPETALRQRKHHDAV